jgi:hypothetical protein
LAERFKWEWMSVAENGHFRQPSTVTYIKKSTFRITEE